MNTDNFGDPVSFHLTPPAGQSFHLFCEICLNVIDGYKRNWISKANSRTGDKKRTKKLERENQ